MSFSGGPRHIEQDSQPYWRNANGRGTSIDANAIMVDVAPTLADFATT